MRPTTGAPHLMVEAGRSLNTLYTLLYDRFSVLPANILPVGTNRFKIFLSKEEQDQLTADLSITKLSLLDIKVLLNSDQTLHRTVVTRHINELNWPQMTIH